MFIEPSPEALEASASLGAPVVELHTGAWCDALARAEADRAAKEFERLRAAARRTAHNSSHIRDKLHGAVSRWLSGRAVSAGEIDFSF